MISYPYCFSNCRNQLRVNLKDVVQTGKKASGSKKLGNQKGATGESDTGKKTKQKGRGKPSAADTNTCTPTAPTGSFSQKEHLVTFNKDPPKRSPKSSSASKSDHGKRDQGNCNGNKQKHKTNATNTEKMIKKCSQSSSTAAALMNANKCDEKVVCEDTLPEQNNDSDFTTINGIAERAVSDVGSSTDNDLEEDSHTSKKGKEHTSNIPLGNKPDPEKSDGAQTSYTDHTLLDTKREGTGSSCKSDTLFVDIYVYLLVLLV